MMPDPNSIVEIRYHRLVELREAEERAEKAEEALYTAHDFISRVLKWEGDDDTEQSELLEELDRALPAPQPEEETQTDDG